MCMEPFAGCATMSYLPILYCFLSSIGGAIGFPLDLLSPDRPVFVALLLDLEAQHRLRVDAVHAARLFFRQVIVQPFAEDEQPFGACALEGELAVLQPLLPRRRVRPGTCAVHVWRAAAGFPAC